jgi:hypothetical protein
MSHHLHVDRRQLPPATPYDEAAVLKLEIEATRQELADTVGAITDKLNIKARAHDKISDATHRVGQSAVQVRDAAAPALARVQRHRTGLAVGALGAVLALLVLRRATNHTA